MAQEVALDEAYLFGVRHQLGPEGEVPEHRYLPGIAQERDDERHEDSGRCSHQVSACHSEDEVICHARTKQTVTVSR